LPSVRQKPPQPVHTGARGPLAGRAHVPDLPTTRRLAAVATFDADRPRAECNVVFDLDVSKGGPARVVADAERLAAPLAGVGAAYVVDESPSGGLHVHVPLAEPAEPAEFAEVAPVMRAAKALFVRAQVWRRLRVGWREPERGAGSDTSENLLTRLAVTVDGSSSGGSRLSAGTAGRSTDNRRARG